jgi:hypothetical protein
MNATYIKIARCAVVRRPYATKFCVELLAKSGGGLPIKCFESKQDAIVYAQALSDRITVANGK